MSFLQPIINCLCEGDYPRNDEHEPNKTSSSEDDMATKIVDLIYKTEKHGNALKAELQGIIQTNGWSERLAEAIHAAIEVAVRNGRVMGPVIQGAYDRAVLESKKVKEFVDDNPMLCSIIALGIIALLTPWLLEALGFGIEGITEGSLAARWQAMYAGYVPKGSLFSYLQSLGTKLRWYP